MDQPTQRLIAVLAALVAHRWSIGNCSRCHAARALLNDLCATCRTRAQNQRDA